MALRKDDNNNFDPDEIDEKYGIRTKDLYSIYIVREQLQCDLEQYDATIGDDLDEMRYKIERANKEIEEYGVYFDIDCEINNIEEEFENYTQDENYTQKNENYTQENYTQDENYTQENYTQDENYTQENYTQDENYTQENYTQDENYTQKNENYTQENYTQDENYTQKNENYTQENYTQDENYTQENYTQDENYTQERKCRLLNESIYINIPKSIVKKLNISKETNFIISTINNEINIKKGD